ncbi:hypothetical protein, partial [Thiococcus pfennigii]|uniref:hypothetical protein n=1 Tax=Thiococcus pfennigii TaxID=1057 RepID=UPI001903A6DD
MAAEFNPDRIAAGELLDAQIVITNPTASPTGELSLRVLWPEHIYIAPNVTGGGGCPGNCDPGEYLVWDTTDLGSLPAGRSLSVGFNETIRSDVPNGTVIPFEIELFESGALARTLSHAVVVNADSPLELTVDPLSDPASADDFLVYELTYGNNGDDVSSDTLLQFPLPIGGTFDSASGGGSYADGLVTWMLGDVPARNHLAPPRFGRPAGGWACCQIAGAGRGGAGNPWRRWPMTSAM